MGAYGKEGERNEGLGDPRLVRSKSAVMGMGLPCKYLRVTMQKEWNSSLALEMEPGQQGRGTQSLGLSIQMTFTNIQTVEKWIWAPGKVMSHPSLDIFK